MRTSNWCGGVLICACVQTESLGDGLIQGLGDEKDRIDPTQITCAGQLLVDGLAVRERVRNGHW
ncbi:MAG: hypothetical protein GDA52_08285 [Rhodobacteraceae bacterium]|nr:hypothetical protein [Paracoccaceae bacterium]